MPLPSQDDVLRVLRGHPGGLAKDDVADALSLGKKERTALLRLLDNWVYEGVLEGRSGDRFALAGSEPVVRETFVPRRNVVPRPAESQSGRSKEAKAAAKASGNKTPKGMIPSSTHTRGGGLPTPTRKGTDRSSAQQARSAQDTRGSSRDVRGSSHDVRGSSRDVRGSSRDVRGNDRNDKRGPAPRGEAPWAVDRGNRKRDNEREGTVSINARGFGFVSSVQYPGQDVFIPEEKLGGAMHGDTVVVRVTGQSSRGVDGEVLRISVRGKTRIGGILRRKNSSAWVEADDTRFRHRVVLTGTMDTQGAEGNSGEDGDSVVVEITRFPEMPDENPEGRLLAVLGRPGVLGTEVRKALLVAGIEEVHSASATEQAESYGETVPTRMLAGRVDLTAIPLPTIDPEDARDHDDAVWVTRKKNGGFQVHVAIADVSSYVTPGTALDEEARERGCSVYLPERAIPMLPRALSSNLCSLLPDQIRLCLCVVAELDAQGVVEKFDIVRGFMKSQAKLTYGGVARALGLSENPPVDPKAEAMKSDLQVAQQLSLLLRAKRMERGSLDFELPEPQIVFDAERQPTDVKARGTDPGMKKAYQLIEELMLLGNELVAQYLVKHDLPGIFRVHLPPDEAKLARLSAMCELLCVDIDVEEAQNPKSLSKLLLRLGEHPQKHILHGLLLRSMKQAAYDVQNLGHFGLASKSYLHFTSPIRRYPDLVVHRVVHAAVQGERIDRSDEGRSDMTAAAALASSRERRAMEVEREVLDLYKCTIMQQRVGETFPGTVTAIVGSGLFIGLTDPFVDVMVRFEDLGHEPFGVSEDGLRVYGKRSGFAITLGDQLSVEILEASLLRRTVYAKRVGVISSLAPDAEDLVQEEGFGEKSSGRRNGAGGAPSRRKAGSGSGSGSGGTGFGTTTRRGNETVVSFTGKSGKGDSSKGRPAPKAKAAPSPKKKGRGTASKKKR